jgi:type VI secretion system secreted protein VgrG
MTMSETVPQGLEARGVPAAGADPTAPVRNLTLRVASGDRLDVRSFEVSESMSSLFAIEIMAMSDDPDVDFDAIVGQPATFRIESRGVSRSWSGICRHAEQVAVEDRGLSTYRLTLAPTLWLASQRRNRRMFQQMSELDIARKLLAEWGVEHRVETTGSYKPRKYRVQYGESDLAFIDRMLEEAGIAYFFEQTDDLETRLVLADTPQSAPRRADPLPFRDRPTVADREHATRVASGQSVRPGKVTVRDHDTRLPADYPLVASAGSGRPVEDRLEQFEYAPGAFQFVVDGVPGTPTADDKFTSRSDEAEGKALVAKRLEAERGSAKIFTFETNAHDLAPGVVFAMVDHPRAELGKPLLVVSSRHVGAVGSEWTHRCEARHAERPYRPALRTPKPRTTGVECATVVGAKGDEIHCDEFGRVRVHFHWDRESKMDDNSSCWIHVSQSWGGAGYGGSNLPRVGQEVIVDFLGGDPDRPLITGRVYTNLQKTPYKLPENKTQSGWKSCSTHQTGGYNEVMFEDAAGKELLRMQAEKDLDKLVKNDERVVVGHDREKLVKNDDRFTVNRDRSKAIDRDESVVIGRDRTKLVKNDDDLTVGNDRSKLVKKNERDVVGANRTRKVGVNETITIGAAQKISVGANQSVSVGGMQNVKVSLAATETIGAVKALTVGAAYEVTVGGMMNTRVAMTQTEDVGLTKTVTVGQKITLSCGRSKMTMSADGVITWSVADGASIVLEDKNITLQAGGGGTVFIFGGPDVQVNP